MRFWDSSALIPLYVAQAPSKEMRALFEEDPAVVVWMFTDVEIWSAICRLGREGSMATAHVQEVASRLESFWQMVRIVAAIDAVKARAKRLLNLHSLRAADSLQLAAALTVVRDQPLGRSFVCLDQRLADAARREGFTVLP